MEKIVKSGMRTTGRFALDGSECKVVFSAPYRCFEVKNEGTADIVVSIEKGKAATDSGVIIVAPQTSATLAHMRPNVSTVYITGEGNVQVVGKNEVEAVFKSGVMGGGDVTINGVSQTYVDSRDSAVLKAAKDYADEAAEKINAKNAIACDNKPTYADGVITYTKDGVAYSTDDIDTWFYYNDGEELKQTIFVDGEEFTITSAGKVDFTEFVTSSDVTSTYTGNEGDTSKIPDIAALRMLDSKITGNISKPNLIINPDFKINQRGQTEYTGDWIYSVDRWQSFSCKVIPISEGIQLSLGDAEYFSIMQKFENTLPFGQYTISLSINNNIYYGTGTLNEDGFSIYFNQSRIELHSDRLQIYITDETDITLNWVKLEFGSIATPFVPPDTAAELVKCKRYFERIVITQQTIVISTGSNRLQMPSLTHYDKRIDSPTVIADEAYFTRFSDNAGIFGALVKKLFTGFYCTRNIVSGYINEQQTNVLELGQVGYISDPINIYIDAEIY